MYFRSILFCFFYDECMSRIAKTHLVHRKFWWLQIIDRVLYTLDTMFLLHSSLLVCSYWTFQLQVNVILFPDNQIGFPRLISCMKEADTKSSVLYSGLNLSSVVCVRIFVTKMFSMSQYSQCRWSLALSMLTQSLHLHFGYLLDCLPWTCCTCSLFVSFSV